MAKAPTMKTKPSMFDWFKPKQKPAARPASGSATMTNLKAAGGAVPAAKAAAERRPAAPPPTSARALSGFRIPFIAAKPFITQMKILGSLAVLLMAAIALVVFQDTRGRTRNA